MKDFNLKLASCFKSYSDEGWTPSFASNVKSGSHLPKKLVVFASVKVH